MVVGGRVSSAATNEDSGTPQAATVGTVTREEPSALQLDEGGTGLSHTKDISDMATSRLERRPSLCMKIGLLVSYTNVGVDQPVML